MEFVINYELSNIAETYVHRIGRTGRAGAKGTAFSFCNAEEKVYLKDIERLIGKKIEVIADHPFPLMDHNPAAVPQQQRSRHGNQPGNSSNQRARNNQGFNGSGNNNRKKWLIKKAS